MFDLLLSRPWPTIPARAACLYITPRPPTNPALPNVLTPVRSRQTFQAQATPHTITYQNGHVWFHDHDTSDLAFRQAIDAAMEEQGATGGAGLRILTESVNSPTIRRAIGSNSRPAGVRLRRRVLRWNSLMPSCSSSARS